MPVGGEPAAVQNPFLRYAEEAGWMVLSWEEALDDGHGGTRFKLSVTSRLKEENVVCSITSEEQLRELFEEELRLGLENYDWSEQNCHLPGSWQLPGR